MNIVYQHTVSTTRGYEGILFDNNEAQEMLSNNVKDLLLDTPQRNELLNSLQALKQDTGFEASETLLVDIQALQDENVNVQDFRIGEAIAEVVLQQHFSCQFYWNELRDARNPKGNKAGADLVGFIEIDNEVLFLFGEVKTSSENNSPPQVMTNPGGIEHQLQDLYNDINKRRILISYIYSKLPLVDNQNFKNDFDNALKNYYRKDGFNYTLYGILVRDTPQNESDVKDSYDRLKLIALKPIGLKLLAIYLPVPKNKWLSVINKGAL
jgi:hypothetical protein